MIHLASSQLKDLEIDQYISTTEQISDYVNNISIDFSHKYLSKENGGIISDDVAINKDLSIGENLYVNGKNVDMCISDISSSVNISKEIIEDRFTTKFEVLPTKAIIRAGSASYLSVDEHIEHCLFQNMC